MRFVVTGDFKFNRRWNLFCLLILLVLAIAPFFSFQHYLNSFSDSIEKTEPYFEKKGSNFEKLRKNITSLCVINRMLLFHHENKMPYKENNSLLVMVYFMSRSALAKHLFHTYRMFSYNYMILQRVWSFIKEKKEDFFHTSNLFETINLFWKIMLC